MSCDTDEMSHRFFADKLRFHSSPPRSNTSYSSPLILAFLYREAVASSAVQGHMRLLLATALVLLLASQGTTAASGSCLALYAGQDAQGSFGDPAPLQS